MSDRDHKNEHERTREEFPAYLLGVLPPDEANACERHIAECDLCRADAEWLIVAVDRIPRGVPRVEPSTALRERVLAEVRADAEARVGVSRPRFSWLRGLVSTNGWRSFVGVTAVLLLICGIVAGFWIGFDGSPGTDSDSTTFVGGEAPGVSAEVEMVGDSATLRLTNVDPLPASEVLQAWVERDGEVEPVQALFAPDRFGEAETTIEDMRGVDAVMVTTEPRGGSATPTSTPFVTVRTQ